MTIKRRLFPPGTIIDELSELKESDYKLLSIHKHTFDSKVGCVFSSSHRVIGLACECGSIKITEDIFNVYKTTR